MNHDIPQTLITGAFVGGEFSQSRLYSTQSAIVGAQWLSGRVLDSRPKGRRFEPHRRHCVGSLSKNINPSLVLVQPRKTRPFITERLLMGRKESNQTNKLSAIERYASIDRSQTQHEHLQLLKIIAIRSFKFAILREIIK